MLTSNQKTTDHSHDGALPIQFEKNGHKLILGDAIDILDNHIEDNCVDLIFVDPPYNIGKNFNGRALSHFLVM